MAQKELKEKRDSEYILMMVALKIQKYIEIFHCRHEALKTFLCEGSKEGVDNGIQRIKRGDSPHLLLVVSWGGGKGDPHPFS